MYFGYKFAHLLIAIIALGTSAALGILLAFFAGHPTHDAFVLGLVRKLMYVVVAPGYVLMLATGMWMGHLAGLLDARWTEAAMNLWGLGAVCIALSLFGLQQQIRRLESGGRNSRTYRRAALLSRSAGAGFGVVVLVILYFMVFKPT
jgi:hypothetical protein